MTKNEKLKLHSLKCEVENSINNMGSGPEMLHIVKFSLTNEEICALSEALNNYYDHPLSRKLYHYLESASSKVGMKL